MKGDTIAEHDANLFAAILRLKENGFTVNYPKCVIRTQSLNFHGHIISKDGISADPQKLDAIREAPPPQTPEEVRSLLGMSNYVSWVKKQLLNDGRATTRAHQIRCRMVLGSATRARLAKAERRHDKHYSDELLRPKHANRSLSRR